MNEPSIRKPTRKAFHFPKSASADGAAAAPQVKSRAAAAPKVSRGRAAAKAKPLAEAKTDASPKTNAKAKADARVKATPARKPRAAAAADPAPAAKRVASPAPVAADGKVSRAKKDVAKKDEAKKETVKKNAPKKDALKKEKVVRDSFTMPKSDYAKIAVLKQKGLQAGLEVKKSEVLRAGLLLLERASSEDFLAAIAAVETVKTGRPAKD